MFAGYQRQQKAETFFTRGRVCWSDNTSFKRFRQLILSCYRFLPYYGTNMLEAVGQIPTVVLLEGQWVRKYIATSFAWLWSKKDTAPVCACKFTTRYMFPRNSGYI